MIMKWISISVTISVLLSHACFAFDEQSKSFAAPQHETIRSKLREDLKFYIHTANKNKHEQWIVRESLHEAYSIAFQLGEFNLAKKLITAALAEGYELPIWDYAALAEIAARENNYPMALEKISYVIGAFKKAKCKFNPLWEDFRSTLSSDTPEAIEMILSDKKSPVLIQTIPESPAEHRYRTVSISSLDNSIPKEVPVEIIIDQRGRVQCVQVDSENAHLKKIMSALKQRHFNPAKIGTKSVWHYGKSYIILNDKGFASLQHKYTQVRRELRIPSPQDQNQKSNNK